MRWLILFAAFPLFAVYVGNPADPAIMDTGLFSSGYSFFKFTTGYIYDYTSDKRYEDQDKAIRKFGLHSRLASFSFIFLERLQLFGTAGGTKEVIEERALEDIIFDTHTSYHFSWSAGAKVILLQWWQTYLSTDFTYFSIPQSNNSYFKYLNRLNLPLEDDEKKKLSLDEWQISAGLSSRFFFLTPYGGVSYLRSRLHADVNYRNEVSWGYFYGLTLSMTGRFHVNFERRLRDEFAYTVSTIVVF